MKTAAHHPHLNLAEDIEANLRELQHKYAHKLKKPLAHTMHKLSHRFAKLLEQHTLAHNHKAARKIARYLVGSMSNAFTPPAAPALRHAGGHKKRRPA